MRFAAVYKQGVAEKKPRELYWDEASMAASRATPGPSFGDQAGPNDLVIGTSRERVLVIIRASGEVVFGPEYKPDEAAAVFWEAMGRQRVAQQERQLLIQHMEAVLTRLGVQDMRTEDLRLQAQAETDPNRRAELRAAGDAAMARLNMIAHQAIELGRALVRRPGIPLPSVPEEVPPQDANSAYEGREGLPLMAEDVPSATDKKLN